MSGHRDRGPGGDRAGRGVATHRRLRVGRRHAAQDMRQDVGGDAEAVGGGAVGAGRTVRPVQGPGGRDAGLRAEAGDRGDQRVGSEREGLRVVASLLMHERRTRASGRRTIRGRATALKLAVSIRGCR
jgi:hypothetical protein